MSITTGYAQQPTLELSSKHLKKIEKIKDGKKKLKRYKKYYSRDSVKYSKRLKKYWKKKTDSLFQASEIARKKKGIEDKYLSSIPKLSTDSISADSLKSMIFSKGKTTLKNQESIKKAEEKLDGLKGENREYVEALKRAKNPDSLNSYAQQYATDKVNGLEGKAENLKEIQQLKANQQQFEEIKNTVDKYKEQVDA